MFGKEKENGLHVQAEDVAIPEVLVDDEENQVEATNEEEESKGIDFSTAIPEIHFKIKK